MSKWNEETEARLVSLVTTTPVTQENLKNIAEEMEVSARSAGSKLRKMGYEVEKVSDRASLFSPAHVDEIRAFLSTNHGQFTYAEVAEQVCGGAFSTKQIQGKILSMELTDCVKPTPKKVTPKTYTDGEEALVIQGCAAGDYLEDIADAVGKPVNSVRGKALSLLRAGVIEKLPVQKNKAASKATDPFEGITTTAKTVAELAEMLDKSERGIKVMLTNRGLSASDYVFKEKAE